MLFVWSLFECLDSDLPTALFADLFPRDSAVGLFIYVHTSIYVFTATLSGRPAVMPLG